jgi:hypothetical protein
MVLKIDKTAVKLSFSAVLLLIELSFILCKVILRNLEHNLLQYPLTLPAIAYYAQRLS